MRKILVTIITAGTAGVVWADAANQGQFQQFREQPEARAYLSYSFGGSAGEHSLVAPLHYGLRLDRDSRLQQTAAASLPAVFQLDRDSRGATLASAYGLPFAGYKLRLNQSDSSGASADSGSSWNFFDWTLLAVGVGGAGFLIAEAVRGHSSPDVPPATSKSATAATGRTALTGPAASLDLERADTRWLDAGTGQMGDLVAK
ncbi:MAG: hypothetical protein P4L83_08910 [Nevskia sp.]|nr:hypothetical protein [Nevskia sp.]